MNCSDWTRTSLLAAAALREFPRAWAAGGRPFTSTGICRPEKPHADRELHSAAFRATIPAPTLLIVDVRGDGKLHLHWEIADTRSGAVLARSYVDEPLNFKMASSGPQHAKMVRLQHEAIRNAAARIVHQLR